MKLIITEEQLKKLSKSLSKEIDEDVTDSEPVPPPHPGTSDVQSGGQGYPDVGKWESGVKRGPANQIGVTKWSEIVGSTITRGKANPLK